MYVCIEYANPSLRIEPRLELSKGIASIAVTCLTVRVESKLGTCMRTNSLRVYRPLCFCIEQVS